MFNEIVQECCSIINDKNTENYKIYPLTGEKLEGKDIELRKTKEKFKDCNL